MQISMIIKHACMLDLISSEDDIHFYVDNGYSAASLARPSMTQLIEDVKEKKIDILFAYDLSRISRDIFESNIFLNLMKKYNVIFKCLYDDAKIESAGDRLNTNMKLVYNQYEREKIVERTNDGLKSIADKGRYPLGGKILFGYERGEDKDIYLHEDHSKIVRRMFEMAIERYSIEDICRYVNNQQKKKVFYTYEIRDMFKDKRYAGVLTYKKEQYLNIIPAIVTLEMIEVASQSFRKYKFKQNINYYFDDFVFCVCGHKMTCSCAHGRSRKYFYYICPRCHASISQNTLENYICLNSIELKDKEEYRKELAKESYKLNRKIKKIREMYFNKELTEREYCSLAITIEDKLEVIHF